MKKKADKGEDMLFVGGLFIGLGFGMAYGMVAQGVIIGMGIGFIAMGIVKLMRAQGKLK
jgi:hypothetical protein